MWAFHHFSGRPCCKWSVSDWRISLYCVFVWTDFQVSSIRFSILSSHSRARKEAWQLKLVCHKTYKQTAVESRQCREGMKWSSGWDCLGFTNGLLVYPKEALSLWCCPPCSPPLAHHSYQPLLWQVNVPTPEVCHRIQRCSGHLKGLRCLALLCSIWTHFWRLHGSAGYCHPRLQEREIVHVLCSDRNHLHNMVNFPS